MRLFIAINFSDEVKDALCETIAELREVALRGRFTARENLHLTLAFIGESNRVDDVLDVMEDVADELVAEWEQACGSEQPSDSQRQRGLGIALSGAGAFGGRDGDLHWVGVTNTPELKTLAARLATALRAEGFAVEKRRFTPHITIGRQVVVGGGVTIRVYPARMKAVGMSLMRSDRVGGRLIYTEIGFAPFG